MPLGLFLYMIKFYAVSKLNLEKFYYTADYFLDFCKDNFFVILKLLKVK